jgi:outer membrane protein assembly factor BamA
VAASLSVGERLIVAQLTVNQTSEPCRLSKDDQPAEPEISIIEVTLLGPLQMPLSEQEQVAISVKQTTGTCLSEVIEMALYRAKVGWQDRGYFRVQVAAETKTLTSNRAGQRLAVSIQVDEGSRYNLGVITFKNNKVVSDIDFLRRLFPIADGDIFSREKIATRLENLRKAYGELGYVNFTATPDTKFDEENRLISLDVDLMKTNGFMSTISKFWVWKNRSEKSY